MTTPRDDERISAFREWIARLPGDADAAAALLQINRRKIGRMASTIAPPVSLLLDCARRALDAGYSKLALRLTRAAAPRPIDGGAEITDCWIDEADQLTPAMIDAVQEASHA